MGPFPHDAPKATISDLNPAGTDGFEFVEFAHPEPEELRSLFAKMGYALTATHKTKAIELWQQGDITYVLNNEPASHARRFVEEHGPARPRWRGGWSTRSTRLTTPSARAQSPIPARAKRWMCPRLWASVVR